MKTRLKANEIIYIAFSNLRRHKLFSLLNIAFITLGLLMIITTLSFYPSLDSFYENIVFSARHSRSLSVSDLSETISEEQAIEKISKLPYVISIIYPARGGARLVGHPILSQSNFDGDLIFISGDENSLPRIVAGKGFSKSSSNVGIIPDKFSPTDINEYNITKVAYIDGKSLLGQELTVKYYSFDYSQDIENPTILDWYEYTFTVVGIYDSDTSWENRNVVFVPSADARTIQVAPIGNLYEVETPGVILGPNNPNDPKNWRLLVIVDQFSNVDPAIVDIRNMGLQAGSIIEIDYAWIDFLKMISLMVAYLFLFVALINTLISSAVSFKARVQEVGTLKAMGFPNAIIRNLFVIELVMLGLISYVLATIGTWTALYILIHYVIYPREFLVKIPMQLDMLGLCIGFVLAIILPLLGGLATIRKAANLPPASAMREIK